MKVTIKKGNTISHPASHVLTNRRRNPLGSFAQNAACRGSPCGIHSPSAVGLANRHERMQYMHNYSDCKSSTVRENVVKKKNYLAQHE